MACYRNVYTCDTVLMHMCLCTPFNTLSWLDVGRLIFAKCY